ncbi:MAG: hypothetical protein RL341_614 [Pseudomonadota bacterium]
MHFSLPLHRIAGILLGAGFSALAGQSAAQAAQAAPEKPAKIALVAEVGDQFQYARQKQQVGSNLEPMTRHVTRIPDQSLNMAVLRGLDKAVAADEPQAERILLALNVADTSGNPPQEREAATMRQLVAALEKMPERASWDRIIAVTPKWLFSGRQGMGDKLTGIGLYVQPLRSGNLTVFGESASVVTPLGQSAETLDREDTRSDVYVAPFFYVQVTTFDAKTLKILKQEAKYDYRKTVNKDASALDVEKGFSPDELAGVITDFVESASARAVSQKDNKGTVEVGPTRVAPKQ